MPHLIYNKTTGKITGITTSTGGADVGFLYQSQSKGTVEISPGFDWDGYSVDVATGELIAPVSSGPPKDTSGATLATKAEIEVAYEATINGYITTPHGAFSLATETLARINGALLAAVVDPTFFIDWRLDEGGVVRLGFADLALIQRTMIDTIAAGMVNSATAVALIDEQSE